MFENILGQFDLTLTDFNMILVGMAIFWLYYKLSSHVLFIPLLQLVEARESATIGAQEGASDLIKEAEQLEHLYEDGIVEARREAVVKRLERLAVTGEEVSRIVSDADIAMKEMVKKGRVELVKVEESLRSQLSGDVEPLAETLASQVLAGGRASSVGSVH